MKMRSYKKGLVWLIMIGFLALLACQTPAGRSTGEVIDDSTMTTKVKAKLFADDQLSGFAISVKTFEGEVTLTGAVKSAEQKEKATAIAQSVSGVNSVNNLLKIKP
jgi:hyperosmotically inducible protein